MTPQTKAALAYLDLLLSQKDLTAREIATVLSALRGPDNEDNNLKERTTAIIRAVAFPKTSVAVNRSSFPLGWVFNRMLDPWMGKESFSDNALGDHFTRHARGAAEVLGIWKEKKEGWG